MGVAVASGRCQGLRKKPKGRANHASGTMRDALGAAAREFLEANATLQRVRGRECEELGAAGMLELRLLMLGYRVAC